MSDITSLADARARRLEHLSGPARCYNCDHEWVAVTPTGSDWLECPRCHRWFGRSLGVTNRPGHAWHCKCGCDLFRMAEGGSAYCVDCGLFHEDFR